jgi:hypothetical protein
MIKHVHVFDCDGVLVSSMHRYQTMPCGTRIDLEHWIANCTPEMISKDMPLPHSLLYKHFLSDPEHYVIIATARVCQQADFDMIAEKLGMPNHFIYRKKGDHQSGVTLKLNALKKLLNLNQFKNAFITVYEDNKTYLEGVAGGLGAKRVYVESDQGH